MINNYNLRTFSSADLVKEGEEIRSNGEVWTAVVEAKNSAEILFQGTGATEAEAVKNLDLTEHR
jgi:hypothetical protein